MKNKTLTYLVLSLLCCMSACTSVDLCPEAEHPHITDMRVRLNWGDISKDEIPAEMHSRNRRFLFLPARRRVQHIRYQRAVCRHPRTNG